jgi:ABC-type multidrug transport system fused ATPase/permease subunit
MDYDRIMVMADGRLVEFDTPQNLMANNQSYFHGLVRTSMEEDG